MTENKHAKYIMPARIILIIVFAVLVFVILNLLNNADGAYSKELNIAFVFTKDNSSDRQFLVAAHEIGHYVYFKKLTQAQRDEYENIFKNSAEFISDYSKTNAVENFAEEYAYSTVTFRCNNSVSQSRKEFFKNILDNNC